MHRPACREWISEGVCMVPLAHQAGISPPAAARMSWDHGLMRICTFARIAAAASQLSRRCEPPSARFRSSRVLVTLSVPSSSRPPCPPTL